VPVIDSDRTPIGMLDITDVLQRVDSADRMTKPSTILPPASAVRVSRSA